LAGEGLAAPQEREALLAWLAESTQQMLDALREAGPERGCWTWWGASQSPRTCGAVARHQLQEIAMHTYDAQLTVGAPEPLPLAVALDGVEEFLFTCCTTTVAWPYKPAVVDYHATEGGSWRQSVSADGSRAVRLPESGGVPAAGEDSESVDVSARGTASDLVLAFYGRIPLDSLKFEGDRHIFDLFEEWDMA
jgi:uncharacterized protein (TIGR03083 family)